MPNDVYGYERHMKRRALLIPLGVGIIIASIGVAALLMLLPATDNPDASVIAQVLDKLVKTETDEKVDYSFSDSHISASVVFIAMIGIAIVILSYMKNDRTEFMDAYPHLALEYTPAEVAAYNRMKRRSIIWGAVVCAVGGILFLILAFAAHSMLVGIGIGFIFAGVGVALILHGGMVGKRTDIYSYNFAALKRTSIYELRATQKGAYRDVVLRAKLLSMKAESVNRVVTVIGAVITFALYFLPSMRTPLFWVPLGIALLIDLGTNHRALQKAREDFEESQAKIDAKKDKPQTAQ